jgi:SAM-dependent methyltransferase
VNLMPLLSNQLTKMRIAQVAPHLRGDVVDVGCGSAAVYEAFSDRMTSYTGIEGDAARTAEQFYTRNLEKERLDLPREYDCALLIALIEHIFNQGFLVSSICEVLRPGGTIVLTTPSPFGNDWVHRLGARFGLFHQNAVDDHIVIYNRQRLAVLAREFGMRLKFYRRFQMGCNQVAVLERQDESDGGARGHAG